MKNRETKKEILTLLKKIKRSIETFESSETNQRLFGINQINEMIDTLENKELNDCLDEILIELSNAREKHPDFPQEAAYIKRTSIMMEEAGEAIQAANDIEFHNKACHRQWRKELIQTAAMCIRCLIEEDTR
jgi:hypothetical protein